MYKNLLREFKIYFNEQYDDFITSNNFDPKDNIIKETLYPLLIREFVKDTFDANLINKFQLW